MSRIQALVLEAWKPKAVKAAVAARRHSPHRAAKRERPRPVLNEKLNQASPPRRTRLQDDAEVAARRFAVDRRLRDSTGSPTMNRQKPRAASCMNKYGRSSMNSACASKLITAALSGHPQQATPSSTRLIGSAVVDATVLRDDGFPTTSATSRWSSGASS